MKKTLLTLSFLTSMCMGGAYAAGMYATAQPSTDEKNEIEAIVDGKSLTIHGVGDLSKVTVADDELKVFSATGAGKVYTKSGDNFTAVAKGDAYDAETSYYEDTYTYTDLGTPSTNWNANYSMTSVFTLNLASNQSMHAIYWDNTGTTATVALASTDAQGIQNSNNWNNPDGTTHYYYWCVFSGKYSGTEKDHLTLQMSDFSNGVYTGDGFTITLLDDNNCDTYGGIVNTITPSVDNFFTKAEGSDDYIYRAKGEAFTYTSNMSIYTGASTVTDENIIDDNNIYFFTTHADYVEAAQLPFAQWVKKTIDANGYTTVTIQRFPRVEGQQQDSPMPTITNEITRALVQNDCVETLNLQDTYLPELKNVDNGNGVNDPTFYMGSKPGTWEQNVENNKTLTTLYMPSVKDSTTLWGSYMNGKTDAKYVNRRSLFYCLEGLKNLSLSEGITKLDTYALYESSNPYKLKTLAFPNTLDSIMTYAINGQDSIEVFTFPKDLKLIEKEAFNGTNPKDVYFLGLEAPKVEKFAWGDKNYIANNSLTLTTKTDTTSSTTVGGLTVELSRGVATRNTYMTQNGWMTYLHYPAKCTKAQAAKYTDITRLYKKIHYNDPANQRTDEGGTTKTYYSPGKETEDLKGTGESDVTKTMVAPKEFFNEYPWPSTQFEYEWFGGDYSGGYDDVFVGSQYTWPSISMAQRATIVAQNGLTWDGVTKIGDVIKDSLTTGESYDGDGSEYIGLHQFVFASPDVTGDDTKDWDMEKYADGKWHSICVPFDATKAKLKEVFGPKSKNSDGSYEYDIRLCKFSGVTREYGANKETHLTLKFNDEKFMTAGSDDETVLIAHNSYMIWAEKSKIATDTAIVLKNYVTVAGSALPTVVTASDNKAQYEFVGQYNPDTKIPTYNYFFSKTKERFRFTGENEKSTWTAYTSVIQPLGEAGTEDYSLFFNDGNTNNDSKISTLLNDDNETTGIDKVTIVVNDDEVIYTNENVYNLNGQLVSTNGIDGLAKGIYVVNGKKLMVK